MRYDLCTPNVGFGCQGGLKEIYFATFTKTKKMSHSSNKKTHFGSSQQAVSFLVGQVLLRRCECAISDVSARCAISDVSARHMLERHIRQPHNAKL